MIEIKIPKEITDYKEKFLFGLTVRQLVSVVVALAICIPLFIFGKDYLGEDLVGCPESWRQREPSGSPAPHRCGKWHRG